MSTITDITYNSIKDIVLGKLVYKTVDADYEELSEKLFGEGNCFNSSEVRKRMYGMKTVIEAVERDKANAFDSSDTLSRYEAKRIEMQKECRKVFDQRREYNKLITEQGRFEHIVTTLSDEARILNETVGSLYSEPYDWVETSDNEAVLVFCDWHYGMTTNNIWNKYDTGICKSRVRTVVENAIERIVRHECNKVHVVLLGDMIHGSIHTTARVAAEELTCGQLMQVSEIIAQSISEIAKYTDEVYVYATYGNHARTIQDKKQSIHRDNLERIIPWWLEWRLAGSPTIHIVKESENEFIRLDACGYGICASHGDLDTVKTAPKMIPALFQHKYNQKIDCILLADKHHREEFEELGVPAMIAGSLCGTDDYANEKRLYSVPEQLLLIFTPNYGIDATYHIKCE